MDRPKNMCQPPEYPPEMFDEYFESAKKRALRASQIESILGDDYDLDRLRELVEADRDWQCGIPPVKMHQTIYRVFDGKIIEETVCNAIWGPFMARPRWKIWVMGSGLPYYWNDCIGKTVFITRESAKAALKGDQHGEQ